MKLSQRHQATLDEYFPDGYDAKELTKSNGEVVDESDYFHIMYIDIQPDGARTRDVPCVQKYSVQDWVKTKKIIEGEHKLIQSDIHVTGHDEYAILHDPVEAKAKAAKAKLKAEEAAEKKAKAAEAKLKADAVKKAKAEKAKAEREARAKVKPQPEGA